PDHLLGDLRRRAEQKTVLQELGELVVEIVACRHHLVLPPGAVGVVFLFEIRLRPADRFGAGRCDKHLAPHRYFARERLAVFLEPLAEPGARHLKGLELDLAIADAAAEYQLAAR